MPPIPVGLADDRYVSAIQVKEFNTNGGSAGGKFIFHHALMNMLDVDGKDSGIGGWPNTTTERFGTTFERGAGRLVRAGSQLSYHCAEKGGTQRSRAEARSGARCAGMPSYRPREPQPPRDNGSEPTRTRWHAPALRPLCRGSCSRRRASVALWLPLKPAAQGMRLLGESVAPVYEGFERNVDGSFNLLFGYYNRNWEEEIDFPDRPGQSDRARKRRPGAVDALPPPAQSVHLHRSVCPPTSARRKSSGRW